MTRGLPNHEFLGTFVFVTYASMGVGMSR